jgi:hypothetical protein
MSIVRLRHLAVRRRSGVCGSAADVSRCQASGIGKIWLSLAVLSRRDGHVTPVELHGKEGVNGSSPLGGFAARPHVDPETDSLGGLCRPAAEGVFGPGTAYSSTFLPHLSPCVQGACGLACARGRWAARAAGSSCADQRLSRLGRPARPPGARRRWRRRPAGRGRSGARPPGVFLAEQVGGGMQSGAAGERMSGEHPDRHRPDRVGVKHTSPIWKCPDA